MYFTVCIMKLNPDGVGSASDTVTKIVSVSASKNAPTELRNGNGEGCYMFFTDDDEQINKLINDHENIGVTAPSGENTLDPLVLIFLDASQEPSARYIPSEDWRVRVRPAFMRACTTKDAFNL